MGKTLVGMVIVLMVSGCSLNPYKSEFMCAASADHGKCETVEQAYAEALAGKKGGAITPSKSRPPAAPPVAAPGAMKVSLPQAVPARAEGTEGAQDRYLAAQYQKLAALVEEPVTPIIQPAKALRTLILSYPVGESLYMPRYVYYFAEAPKFVIGQYLNPDSTAKTLYPNGAP